jgi:hypothetical protein
MPRCNAPRILDAYLHRSLEACNWHAPSQSSQPSCLRFTATSLDDIGWSPPDWSSALFSACLVKFRTANDLDVASDLVSHWYSRLASAPFSLSEAIPSIQVFGTVFVVNLHQLWNCMFSRPWLIHWPSRYLRRAILLAFSVDPGVRTLKDAEASCFALHTLCTCSAAEAASLADACTTSYLLFTPEDRCGRTTSLPIPTVTPSMNFFKNQSHVQAMLSGGEVHGVMIHHFTLFYLPLNLPKS